MCIRDRYADAINYLQQYDIIIGRDATHFQPEAPITRAEFVTICTRFDTFVTVDTVNDFSDVSASHWAYAFINYAVHEKWITGYEDNTFRPDASITRAEAVQVTLSLIHILLPLRRTMLPLLLIK